ncbi:MAG: N-acetylmuramoyl-L-alanine amidase [Bdellovibrionales bacterium]|nr:N-acetylmuramoyl-L-alanine amidase [Bdellovibrionales bacterium]
MRGFLLLLIFLILPFPSWATYRIAVDPGHGGDDKGAVYQGIKEADVALEISRKLYQLLKKDPQYQTLLLRHGDKDLSLEERVKMAKAFKSDLFISIHANAHQDARAKGSEFYIQNQLPMDEEKLFLAHQEHQLDKSDQNKKLGDIESILSDIKKGQRILKSYELSRHLRKNWPRQKKSQMIRQGPFFVLSQNEVPAVLVEVGYLSNAQEREQLTQPSVQKDLAHRIYKAIKAYRQ